MAKGKVTRVPDGDTIKVKEGPYIRLAGVDAPEKRQKGFSEAKENLKNLVMGKTVTYTKEATDRYSRVVGIESYLQKEYPHNVRREVADNYSKLVDELERLIDDNLEDFKIPPNAYYLETNYYCYMDLFLPRLIEFRHYLEVYFPFVKHDNLPGEVRVYLSVRQGIINIIKKQVEKRV